MTQVKGSPGPNRPMSQGAHGNVGGGRSWKLWEGLLDLPEPGLTLVIEGRQASYLVTGWVPPYTPELPRRQA